MFRINDWHTQSQHELTKMEMANSLLEIKTSLAKMENTCPSNAFSFIASYIFYKFNKYINMDILRPRDILFEFHLKFWNTASIVIPVRSLLSQLSTVRSLSTLK